MRTFIISLKQPGEKQPGGTRNAELIELLGRIGFEAEIFSAVDGRKLIAGEYFDAIQHYLRARGVVLTPSEVGCSLSHTEVIKRIISEDLASALVLEDDALIDREALGVLARLRELAVFESGLIHLGAQEGLEHLTRLAHGTPDQRLDGLWKVHPADLSKIYRAVGYMVSRKDAMRLGELGLRGAYLADDWSYVMENGALDSFFICDCIGHPKNTAGSNIQPERKFMRSLIKKRDMSLAARLMREIRSTMDSRWEKSLEKKRLQGQQKISWNSRWSDVG